MEYTSFGPEAPIKSGLKHSKKWAVVGSVTLTLCVCIGMICCFSWELEDSNAKFATSIASEMEKMMTDPQHIADTKRFAKALKARNFDPDVIQAQGMSIAEQMKELLADPDFVKDANHVAAQVKAVMGAPIVQEQTKRFNKHIEAVIADLNAEKHQVLGRRLLSKPSTSHIFRSSVGSRPKMGTMLPRPFRAKRDISVAAGRDYFPLVQRLGELKLSTALSNTGILTAAEESGVFSALEKQGAFSTAERLLPLVDQLGLLQTAQEFLDKDSSEIAVEGAVLASLGPIYVALNAGGVLPSFITSGPAGITTGLVATGGTAAGVVLIIVSTLVAGIQKGEDPITIDGALIKSIIGVLNPEAGGRGVKVPIEPPARRPVPKGPLIDWDKRGFLAPAFTKVVDSELALGEVGFYGDKGRFWQENDS